MALDAARSNLDEEIFDAYKASQPYEFTNNCASTRTKLISISLQNGWAGSNDIIPESFPDYLTFHKLVNPVVSSKQALVSLRDLRSSQYLCSALVRLNDIIDKTAWTQFMQATIAHHIRKAIALRMLLELRDIPRGMSNTLQWQIKHFVSRLMISLIS